MNYTYWILMLALLYFSIGALVVLFRRNALIMLMGLELMLNSANFALITVGNVVESLEGQVFALVILAIAAAEVALGLAIVINLYRLKGSANIDEFNSLKSD